MSPATTAATATTTARHPATAPAPVPAPDGAAAVAPVVTVTVTYLPDPEVYEARADGCAAVVRSRLSPHGAARRLADHLLVVGHEPVQVTLTAARGPVQVYRCARRAGAASLARHHIEVHVARRVSGRGGYEYHAAHRGTRYISNQSADLAAQGLALKLWGAGDHVVRRNRQRHRPDRDYWILLRAHPAASPAGALDPVVPDAVHATVERDDADRWVATAHGRTRSAPSGAGDAVRSLARALWGQGHHLYRRLLRAADPAGAQVWGLWRDGRGLIDDLASAAGPAPTATAPTPATAPESLP